MYKNITILTLGLLALESNNLYAQNIEQKLNISTREEKIQELNKTLSNFEYQNISINNIIDLGYKEIFDVDTSKINISKLENIIYSKPKSLDLGKIINNEFKSHISINKSEDKYVVSIKYNFKDLKLEKENSNNTLTNKIDSNNNCDYIIVLQEKNHRMYISYLVVDEDNKILNFERNLRADIDTEIKIRTIFSKAIIKSRDIFNKKIY